MQPNEQEFGRFPQEQSSLPPEIMAGLISGLGNDETKLLTVAALEPGIIYDLSTINSRMQQLLGSNPSPYKGHTLFIDYMRNSLSQIDIVSVRDAAPDEVFTDAFVPSRFGLTTAKAFAGHMLSLSERYPERSLSKTFGKTSSGSPVQTVDTAMGPVDVKKRGPQTRYRIFYELLVADLPIRIADLAKALDEKPEILQKHLNNLARNNIIQYEAVDNDKPVTAYRVSDIIPDESFFRKSQYPELTYEAYRAVHSMTSNDLAAWVYLDDIVKQLPVREYGNKRSGENVLGARVHALRNLYKAGFLQLQKFSAVEKSRITITDEQRQYLAEVVYLLLEFQRQDPSFMNEGIQRAREIVSNPNRVYALMNKARENSSQANQMQASEMIQAVISCFSDGEILGSKEIMGRINSHTGRILTREHIRGVLLELEQSGRLSSEVVKHKKHWKLN